ncbi:hypothetical protein ABIA31_006175 [Catenulispora sp. MAP5-51]|uniref:hypothetical protein n=1 Tax=Catenulispora sp. MAP5-51 TaxID=3156298 RepID=UPI003518A423
MLSRTFTLRPWSALDTRYDQLEVLATTVNPAGTPVTLLADTANAAIARPEPRGIPFPPEQPYDALLVIGQGDDRTEIPVSGLLFRFPHLDAWSGGFAVAKARNLAQRNYDPVKGDAGLLPHNIATFDLAGAQDGSFYAGDGIEVLSFDEGGTIWTSYFDEASAWLPVRQRRGRSETFEFGKDRVLVHMPGLIRWNRHGEILWAAVHDPMKVDWCDCYALNVGTHRTWACPYTGFPLVDIDEAGIRLVRRNPIRSSGAIAVDGSRAAFVGATADRIPGRYVVTECHLGDGAVEPVVAGPLAMPDGTNPPCWFRRKVARGGRIWVQFDDPRVWYLLQL